MMIPFRISQIFCAVAAVANVVIAVLSFLQGDYVWTSVNGSCAVGLIFLLLAQEGMFARHRREDRELAQMQLDTCWRFAVCPDCGVADLAFFDDGEVMCSEVGCNSRFRRDPVTKKWSRI
jgi:hypothetical protein